MKGEIKTNEELARVLSLRKHTSCFSHHAGDNSQLVEHLRNLIQDKQ